MTPARPHEIPGLEASSSYLWDGERAADNASLSEVFAFLLEQQQMAVQTPPKKATGPKKLRMFEHLWSTSVSRVRQPMESFVNWLEEQPGIHRASKVRSLNGLLVHVYGRLTAAMYLLAFNS